MPTFFCGKNFFFMFSSSSAIEPATTFAPAGKAKTTGAATLAGSGVSVPPLASLDCDAGVTPAATSDMGAAPPPTANYSARCLETGSAQRARVFKREDRYKTAGTPERACLCVSSQLRGSRSLDYCTL